MKIVFAFLTSILFLNASVVLCFSDHVQHQALLDRACCNSLHVRRVSC